MLTHLHAARRAAARASCALPAHSSRCARGWQQALEAPASRASTPQWGRITPVAICSLLSSQRVATQIAGNSCHARGCRPPPVPASTARLAAQQVLLCLTPSSRHSRNRSTGMRRADREARQSRGRRLLRCGLLGVGGGVPVAGREAAHREARGPGRCARGGATDARQPTTASPNLHHHPPSSVPEPAASLAAVAVRAWVT